AHDGEGERMRHGRSDAGDAALRMAAVPVLAVGGPETAPAEGAPYRLGPDLLGAIGAFAASFRHGVRSSCTVIRGAWPEGSTVRTAAGGPVSRFSSRRPAKSAGRRTFPRFGDVASAAVESVSVTTRCRRFIGVEQPESVPADCSKPGPRRDHRPAGGRGRNRHPPAVEVDPGGP